MLIELGRSDDHDMLDRLLAALAAAGATADSFDIGIGLNEYFIGNQRLTVYRDAWTVDLEGPTELVEKIIGWLS